MPKVLKILGIGVLLGAVTAWVVRAQSPATVVTQCATGVHTTCSPNANKTTFCFATDGLYVSINGATFVTVSGTGTQGPVGPTGAIGPTGIKGATGSQGPIGLPGVPGLQGLAGPQGLVGPQGVSGPQGPIGPQGPAGVGGVTSISGKVGDLTVSAFIGAN